MEYFIPIPLSIFTQKFKLMSVDDLLNSALEGRGGSLESSNLFALVGDPKTNEMFVLKLREFLTENFRHFLRSEDAGGILLGAYNIEEDARKCLDSIRDGGLHTPGLVYAPDWHVLLWNAKKDSLYTLTLLDYYVGFLHFFKYKAESGIVLLEIFNTKEAAEDVIDYIRLYIKDENGNIIK